MKALSNSILFIFMALQLILNGCSKDRCPDTPLKGGTYNVNGLYTSCLMPYGDYDTIRFLKNSIDTDIFIGEQIKTSYYHALNAYPCPEQESLQEIQQSFIDKYSKKLTLHFYVLPANNDHGSEYEIVYNTSTFGPYRAGEVTWCRLSSDNIYVTGRNYCVSKLKGTGGDYLYFGDTSGIVKFSINNSIYELLPK